MNKRTLIEKIIAKLAEEVASYARSAKASQAEATDEQSQPENKYDTRGLEAAYLAHGQSRQELRTAQAEQFPPRRRHQVRGPGEHPERMRPARRRDTTAPEPRPRCADTA